MAAENVFVSVTDPDPLIAGDDPVAPFVAAYIQVYRYANEDNARDEVSGTLLDAGSGYTFTLVASTTAPSTPDVDGPYRFGYYDASQVSSSWYRYRFANAALDTFSLLSEPWKSGNTEGGLTLRDLLFEVGDLVGSSIVKGTAGTNATANLVVCTALLQSTMRDARFYEAWHLGCTYDAGAAGAAPEGEEALIASVNTTSGTATLDRSLSAAVTDGDTILLSAYLAPSEMIRCINRAREKMQVRVTTDIALAATENRYPAPWGVKSETDVLDAVIVQVHPNSNREDEIPVGCRVVFDGHQGWIEPDDLALYWGKTLRLTSLRSYRDLEGDLESMGDTTNAPIEWMRPAAAYAISQQIARADPLDQEMQRIAAECEDLLNHATGRYAPEVTRRVKTGAGRRGLPGPGEVN